MLLAALLLAAADPSAALHDFQARCEAAGRQLWGVSLCAPIVVADATGAQAPWTSRAAPGPLPPSRANTSFDWNGTTWLMLLAPLPADAAARDALVFHEAFHVHQRELGLPPNAAVAPHLEGAEARTLIRLEWNALAQALQSKGKVRAAHVRQALAFRAQRLAGHPEAADAERGQMLHEGLAAYTGTALSGAPTRLALEELRGGPGRSGLARTFAYINGPAWGLLLDELEPGWRKGLGTTIDLPDLLGWSPASRVEPERYGAAAIRVEEAAAAATRQARLDRLLAATAPARSVYLPLAHMNMDFDPNRVTPAPDGSTLYEKMTLRDTWGSVHVDGQALRIASDFSGAWVEWPLLSPNALELAAGWKLVTENGAATVKPAATPSATIWQPSAGHVQVPIWPGKIPDALPDPKPESVGPPPGRDWWPRANDVSDPTMTVYSPKGRNTGAAAVVFPGGGYRFLAMDLEGTEICDWLTSRGITCVLLKYRVPGSGPWWDSEHRRRVYPKVQTALQDAQRTLGLVRQHAAEWGVDPHKVGVVGFSAGGHLAAATSTHFDRRTYPRVDAADALSSRPDFAIVVYPGHMWIHEDEDKATRNAQDLGLRPDVRVRADSPPTFLLMAQDDEVDGVSQALAYYVALKQAGVPTEMHLYAQGGHAFGVRPGKFPINQWPALAETWLRGLGMIPPDQGPRDKP
jgi:acetyl esterase/lipase